MGGTAATGTLSPEPPPADIEITIAITAMTIAPNPPNKSQLGMPPVRPLPELDATGLLGGVTGGVDVDAEGVLLSPPEVPNNPPSSSAISPAFWNRNSGLLAIAF